MFRAFTVFIALCSTASTQAADLRQWGLTVDIGAPDAVNLGVAWRPVNPVRFTFSAATNGLGPGARAGIALKVPWDVGPVFAVEAGHFLESDATWLAVRLAGEKAALPVLERVGYTFVNVHGGLEFGHPKATFYIHGGMSGIWATVRGLQELADSEAGEGVLTIEDVTVRAYLPSARVGVVFYFKKRNR